MTPYETLTSPAIPLLRDNISTEIIAPLNGAGRAFAVLRDAAGGALESLFDRPPFTTAAILIVGRDFGLGARSAEAIRALKELGLVCILGVSFAPVFADRAFSEGLIALMLDEDDARALAEEALAGDGLTVDFGAQSVVTRYGERYGFVLPAATRALYLAMRRGGARPERGVDDGGGHFLVAASA